MSQLIEEDLTILFEELDFDLTCEAVNKNCSNTAVWRYESICNKVILLCQKCHEIVQSTYTAVGCSLCGDWFKTTEGPEKHWSWSKI